MLKKVIIATVLVASALTGCSSGGSSTDDPRSVVRDDSPHGVWDLVSEDVFYSQDPISMFSQKAITSPSLGNVIVYPDAIIEYFNSDDGVQDCNSTYNTKRVTKWDSNNLPSILADGGSVSTGSPSDDNGDPDYNRQILRFYGADGGLIRTIYLDKVSSYSVESESEYDALTCLETPVTQEPVPPTTEPPVTTGIDGWWKANSPDSDIMRQYIRLTSNPDGSVDTFSEVDLLWLNDVTGLEIDKNKRCSTDRIGRVRPDGFFTAEEVDTTVYLFFTLTSSTQLTLEVREFGRSMYEYFTYAPNGFPGETYADCSVVFDEFNEV